MSFILDALRKSEHERQRSALPSLAHVPIATPAPQLPRWATLLIALLAAAVLVLAGAWWQSSRTPAPSSVTTPQPLVERPLALPAPTTPSPAATLPAAVNPTRGAQAGNARPLAEAVATDSSAPLAAASRVTAPAPEPAPAPAPATTAEPTLPSAASLISEGIVLPTLRLELHAYADQPSARFVFINGRRYVEGERLADGPDLVAIEPQGAVLSYGGRRFLLISE